VLTLAQDDVIAIEDTPAQLRALAARITAVAAAAESRVRRGDRRPPGSAAVSMQRWLIEVTDRGETAYLKSENGLDLRLRVAMVLGIEQADIFTSQQRAARVAAKVVGRFDSVRVVPAE